jgi:hypothetical protein
MSAKRSMEESKEKNNSRITKNSTKTPPQAAHSTAVTDKYGKLKIASPNAYNTLM